MANLAGLSAAIAGTPLDPRGINASATPIAKPPPVDEFLSKRELGLLRRLRQARREALTATQPAIVTVYLDERGEIARWFVSLRGEG